MTAASGKAEAGAVELLRDCHAALKNMAEYFGDHEEWITEGALLALMSRITAHIATPAAANGPGEAVDDGELWSWLKKVMEQGASIHQDYMAGRHKGYEQYSARMDVAANERTDELIAMLPALASTPQPGMVTVPRELLDYAECPSVHAGDDAAPFPECGYCVVCRTKSALRSGERET